jgi:hypothetical protein
LVTIPAAAQHGEILAILGPIIEKRKHPQPFRAYKGFGANDRDTKAFGPEIPADLLGSHFGFAIGTNPIEPVIFQQRVMVGNPVDRCRRDMNDPLNALLKRALQHGAQAVDVGRIDFFRLVEGQRRRRMNHEIDACHRPLHRGPIPNIALNFGDLAALGVAEFSHIKRNDALSARQQVAHQVDPQEAGASGHQKCLGGALIIRCHKYLPPSPACLQAQKRSCLQSTVQSGRTGVSQSDRPASAATSVRWRQKPPVGEFRRRQTIRRRRRHRRQPAQAIAHPFPALPMPERPSQAPHARRPLAKSRAEDPR